MNKYQDYILKYKLTEKQSFTLIDSESQRLFLYTNAKVTKNFIISTALNGLGELNMSFKTPRGLHQIKDKIGEGLDICSVLKARKFTGEIWAHGNCQEKDLVLTRALWLDGLEEHNSTSFDRYIYIHGTNATEKLGTPCSEGCVRMDNQDVIDYYNLVHTGHLVVIF